MSFDESGTDDAECRRKKASARKVVGAIRSLVNARGLQLEGTTCVIACPCSVVWQ